jgi:hypothetical protein
MNAMPFSVFIDRNNCYNKGVVSVGKHLNIYYIHDSFIHSLLFLFLLIAGGIYLVDKCPLYVTFL